MRIVKFMAIILFFFCAFPASEHFICWYQYSLTTSSFIFIHFYVVQCTICFIFYIWRIYLNICIFLFERIYVFTFSVSFGRFECERFSPHNCSRYRFATWMDGKWKNEYTNAPSVQYFPRKPNNMVQDYQNVYDYYLSCRFFQSFEVVFTGFLFSPLKQNDPNKKIRIEPTFSLYLWHENCSMHQKQMKRKTPK